MILLDNSALVLSLTADRPAAPILRELIASGERLGVPSMVLYEWWRGPRTAEELAIQEHLLPSDRSVPFDHSAARVAADLFHRLPRARARQIDLAIAIAHDARLWTLNPDDFADVPELRLVGSEPP